MQHNRINKPVGSCTFGIHSESECLQVPMYENAWLAGTKWSLEKFTTPFLD